MLPTPHLIFMYLVSSLVYGRPVVAKHCSAKYMYFKGNLQQKHIKTRLLTIF